LTAALAPSPGAPQLAAVRALVRLHDVPAQQRAVRALDGLHGLRDARLRLRFLLAQQQLGHQSRRRICIVARRPPRAGLVEHRAHGGVHLLLQNQQRAPGLR